MAEGSSVDAGAPNLNLNPDEKRVYGQLFRQADSDSVGVVTGEVAVKFFEKTRLDSRILGEIWQIADKENRGFLTPAGFGIVLRLIGHAQAGREPTAELALQQAPLPRFDGFTPAPPVLAAVPTGGPQPIQAQGTGPGPVRIPPLTSEKVSQFASLFERQPLQAGNLLPGEQAKQIFEKSGLPNEILGRIWQLADTEQRGALVLTEFVIAMHLLTSLKTGTLRALPTILPAALYEAATKMGSGNAAARAQSPTSTGPAPLSAIPRQLSGQAQHPIPARGSSPMQHLRSPLAPQSTGDGWLITPADKARFDTIYQDLDKTNKGFITGEEAVPFLSQSNLPEDTLAQIWDLADVRSEGRLNRDEFAVAMYLIRQQRSRRDGPGILPTTLPQNLVPPSMRGSHAVPPAASSPFDAPAAPLSPPQPPPQQKPVSALDDLFGLDSLPAAPAPAPAQASIATGGSNAASDPFAATASPLAPSSPARPSPTTSTFKPFVPSSSFGRALTVQVTGDSNSSTTALPRPAPPQPTAADDLLGDNDPEISKQLTNDTAELANLSNQIGSLSKQMQEVQGQRATAQNELNQASVQKKNFEQRLSQLRALYEKEAKDVRALEEQLTVSRNETKKIQTEMAMLDGSYQDLQNQHRTILAGLQADQQENASLKERIRHVNSEIAVLKPQVEKLKSEARQQKGLVAINKKQLATNEADRDKLKAETDELTRSNEELARQLSSSPPPPAAAAAAAAAALPAQVASPTPSTASANNPFFRRTASTDIMGTFASPGAKTFNDRSFDDVFGPAFTSGTPPPAASFKPQTTGTSAASAGSLTTPGTGSPNASRQVSTEQQNPPPPPQSRQMSSSFLPFGEPTESLTSSRQVSPPASRLGQPDVPLDSPADLSTPLQGAATTDQDIGTSSAPDARVFEVKSGSNGNEPQSTVPANDATTVAASGPGPSEEKKVDISGTGSDSFSAADQAKAKEDFESAFASFKAASAGKASDSSAPDAIKGLATFNTEFPPISELEKDDDSDSDDDDDDDKGGFDDDFAPASPPSGKTADRASSPTLARSAISNQDGAAVITSSSEKASEQPAPVATSSVGEKASDVFGSAPIPGAFPEPSPLPLADTADAGPPATNASSAAGASTAKQLSAFDDLDDDFDGLEDAKEGSADDDFQTISRSGLDDFNPVFDSSPPPSRFNGNHDSNPAPSTVAGTTSATTGADASFDFGSISTSAATSNLGSSGPVVGSDIPLGGKAASQPESHDWDAIFASLDDAPTTSSPPAAEHATTTDNNGTAIRPNPPARILTEDGEHDDPILKNLTSMGYSRADALSALEKYDYNLERAANYLASQS